MSVITSRLGDVQANVGDGGAYEQLDEATKFTFMAEVNKVEYASNKTSGIKVKLAGSKNASGNVEGVYNPNAPITDQVTEEDTPTLRLYLTTSHYIQVPVLIVKIELTVDIDSGEIEKWSFDYDATGTWTYPSALGALVARSSRGEQIGTSAWEKAAEELGANTPEERANLRKLAKLAAKISREHPDMVSAA